MSLLEPFSKLRSFESFVCPGGNCPGGNCSLGCIVRGETVREELSGGGIYRSPILCSLN